MSKLLALSAAFAGLVASSAIADETEGLVMAYDRQDGIVVLEDKTVWQLPPNIDIPANLGRGDRVFFEFTFPGEEDGMTEITAMTRLAVALPADTDGGS